jgi:sugar phosphate isomerase/epimerase
MGVADMTHRFAYGTNGLADHRLADALDLLADLGYTGVSLTLDHQHLDPFSPDLVRRTERIAAQLGRLGLAVVVETGARFLLDPRAKHEPTLVSDAGRERRVAFLQQAIAIAADLGAPVVSCWSGVPPSGVEPGEAWQRLVAGCAPVVDAADAAGISLGFEPEPGMLVATLDDWTALWQRLDRPERFGITLDVGHCHCLEPTTVAECVRRAAPNLVHVQIEDMRRGVHEHLPFGQGTFDVPPALAALREVRYDGLVSVELPRHSHDAARLVRDSLAFLRRAAEPDAAAMLSSEAVS